MNPHLRPWLSGIAISIGIWAAAVGLLFLFGRKTAARELAAFLPNLIILFKGLAQDPLTPRSSKLLLLVGVVWFASPIDLIPEFVPILGPLDDAVVAALILRHVFKTTPPEVIARHWRGNPDLLRRLAGRSSET